MLHNHLTDNEDLCAECDEFELEQGEEPVDEFYEMAVTFAKLAASDSVPNKRRRKYAQLSDLCDRATLANGAERQVRELGVFRALAQLEKAMRAETRPRSRH